ncbi:histidine kinase sensor domain-containing protein, partial [Pantoea sp. SIMBA_133]
EDTWAAVVRSSVQPLAGSELSGQFMEGFRLGRNVEWKIHLYFADNPIMDMTFADGHTHFLITLPQRMRPGTYLPEMKLFLKVALP